MNLDTMLIFYHEDITIYEDFYKPLIFTNNFYTINKHKTKIRVSSKFFILMIYDFDVNFNFLNLFNAERIDLIFPIAMIDHLLKIVNNKDYNCE